MTRQEKEDLLREAVETLIKLDNHMMTSRDNAEFSQWVEDLIEQPQQKTGHWYIDERPESNRETICSSCEQPIFKYHKVDFDYRPKYCPNCGAKME